MRNSPRINMIYYKALLDLSFGEFFELFKDDFRIDNGMFVFSRSISKSEFKKIFVELVIKELKTFVRPFDLTAPDYYVIIGACNPKDNLLLKYKDDSYFPQKLQKLIDDDFSLKYLLKHKDVKIDLRQFNEVCVEIFNDFFKDSKKLARLLGNKHENVFCFMHSQLDCYSVFKSLKAIYGKKNCWNVYKERYSQMIPLLVAVNDLIDRYVKNKNEMCRSNEFKKIICEVKQFVDMKMKECVHG